MTAFVTGGYGLLGSWLVKSLLERGEQVVVLRRDDVPQSALILEGTEARCTVVHGDVADAEVLGRALAEYEVDSVFHLAAQTLVGTATRSPVSTFESNIRGTWTLLEACRANDVARTVVASSDKAYGASEQLPYTEEQPLAARFPYDVSKACTDLIARSYWHTFDLPVAVTRFANLYGGGDLNASRLIPEAVAAVLAGRRPVIRSDGTPQRDFLYVEDAVAAYLAIADALPGVGGEAFNGGAGEPHSVLDVVALVCQVAGTDIEPDVRGAGTPPNEIDRQWLDAGKLRERTGWQPQVSLQDGLRRTVEWYRAHPDALTF